MFSPLLCVAKSYFETYKSCDPMQKIRYMSQKLKLQNFEFCCLFICHANDKLSKLGLCHMEKMVELSNANLFRYHIAHCDFFRASYVIEHIPVDFAFDQINPEDPYKASLFEFVCS